MGEAPVIVALRQEQLEAIMEKAALIGAQTASEIVIKEMAKKDRENKDRRLHNTRLLLEHYRDLKTHCKEAVYEAEGEQSESDMIESLMSVKDDARFREYGLPPKSKADYAFVLHGLHHLKDGGTAVFILPLLRIR